MPAASSDAALTAAPCINIYPQDVCPCSATAKPLSRKVNFTSVSPLSIFHIPPIQFMPFINHLAEDGQAEYLQQLSRVLNRTTVG